MDDAEKIKRASEIAWKALAELPTRVWVEGDGQMYGQFASQPRKRLDQFDAVQLIHKAQLAMNMISSAL